MKMFNLINIGERAGSGIPKIYFTWEKQGLEMPEISEKFNPDRIILSLKISKTADKKPPIRTANNIETIIEYLTANPSAKTAEISELLGLSDRRTRELLKKMVDDELLETNGSKKNRTYSLRR